MSLNQNKEINYLALGTLLVYVTLHLLEEGIFGFPAWAGKRWGIPDYTFYRWLLHNAYFIFFLTAGYLIYRANHNRFLFLGLGIIVWGLLNSLNHIIFSVIFQEYSPGLVTGFIFLSFALYAIKTIHNSRDMPSRQLKLSLLSGVLYWVIPMISFVSVDILILKF